MRRELHALPAQFLERLRNIIPASQWDQVVNTFIAPPPTTFRINSLKTAFPAVWETLMSAGFRLERVPWYPEAVILRGGRLRDLQETALYTSGAIYVQSLSSMVPALVLAPQAGDTVLDITAAPGSKTTQMACLMRGEGRIVANDNNRVRFYKLKATVGQQGAANVTLSRRFGESFARSDPAAFDRVLVDAPCGTEGRFYTGRASSYDYWTPRKIHEMVVKQRRLLQAGASALRPGGVLVYSTCTFAPEENEGVVSWALNTFRGTLELQPVALPIANTMPGLTAWEEKVFGEALGLTLRVLPSDTMEGFFLARLTKAPS